MIIINGHAQLHRLLTSHLLPSLLFVDVCVCVCVCAGVAGRAEWPICASDNVVITAAAVAAGHLMRVARVHSRTL